MGIWPDPPPLRIANNLCCPVTVLASVSERQPVTKRVRPCSPRSFPQSPGTALGGCSGMWLARGEGKAVSPALTSQGTSGTGMGEASQSHRIEALSKSSESHSV